MTKQYVKDYMKFHNIGEQDFILCKACGKIAVDLHHIIFKSACGTDEPSNIIPLCRRCHDFAHAGKLTRDYLQEINSL